MITVKEDKKGCNVPFKGETLGTLKGENLKRYIKSFLDSTAPQILLKYFDNTLEELKEYANTLPKKYIPKPKKDEKPDEQL